MSNLAYPAASSADAVALSLKRFVRLLLLRDQATRQEIGRHGGFSPASVTLSSQWLVEHNFLQKTPMRVASSKRPVEMLALRSLPWSILAIRLDAGKATSDLLDSTGAVLDTFGRQSLQTTQAAIFEALGEELLLAQERASALGKPLSDIVLSVDGTVSTPAAGVIFQLNGLPDWVTCIPKAVHPVMAGFKSVTHWTQAVCKLHGLARKLQVDDEIAYFDVRRRDLHFAIMHRGVVTHGEIGTSGGFLHQSVQPDGPACYCGRPGCLDALLRAGQASPQMMFGAIQRMLEKEHIQHLGIEWQGASQEIWQAIAKTPLRSLVNTTHEHDLERQGLMLLGVETALLHRIDSLQHPGNGN